MRVKIKPPKKLYENQKEISDKFLKFIKPFFGEFKEIKNAYLWGSLASQKFGIYKIPWENHFGSDIDLVIFLEKNEKIPNNWKNLNDFHSWFDVYKYDPFRRFKYKGKIHKVDLLVAYNEKNIKELRSDNKKIKGKFKLIYKK